MIIILQLLQIFIKQISFCIPTNPPSQPQPLKTTSLSSPKSIQPIQIQSKQISTYQLIMIKISLYSISHINNPMSIIFLTLLLLHSALSQPKCSALSFPRNLPALTQQHLLLDMTRYFQGPNLTFTIQETSKSITLQQKFTIAQQRHTIGNVLSIAKAGEIVSMLGITSLGRYYIYFAPINNPHQLKSKALPLTLTQCTNHALSPNGTIVAITCEDSQTHKYAIVYSTLSDDDPWQIQLNVKLILSITREIQFINTNFVVVVISHQNNSYIELWDIKYGRIVGIYDRAFLQKQTLNIMDVQMVDGSLFILDYETGIYQFNYQFSKLYLVRIYPFNHFLKMAVYLDSLVISKKGSVAEFGGRNTFKYEAVGAQIVKQLMISQQYIVAYTDMLMIVYLRGSHTPYFILQSINYQVAGTFITNTKILQSTSTQSSFQILFQQITLNHPYITIPSNVTNNTAITVIGSSKLNQSYDNCRIVFNLLRTQQSDMTIYENTYRQNSTQLIYINRPGRAQLDLTPYGIGPNLTYQIIRYEQQINLTTQIKKVTRIQQIKIQGLQRFTIKGTYFSHSCGLYKNYCPVAIDTQDGILTFQSCVISVDFFNQPEKINCSEQLTQYKIGQFAHYSLYQSSHMNDQFYEVSVIAHIPNQIILRKFAMSDEGFKVLITKNIKINDTTSYGQMNITELEFNEQTNLFYILFNDYKEIQVYKFEDLMTDLQLLLLGRINKQSFPGQYFAPKSIYLDNDDMLWIKNYDQIFVVDPRLIEKIGNVTVVSIINMTTPLLKTYEYTITVVESQPPIQVSAPSASSGLAFNWKYLVIEDDGDVLLISTVNHLYEVDVKQLQSLPKYGNQVPSEINQRYIQSLGNSQVFISLMNPSQKKKINVIYNLNCLSLPEIYYSSIETNISAIPSFFHLGFDNPLVIFIEPKIAQSQIIAYQISKTPKLLLTVQQMIDQSQSQRVILNLFNQLSTMSHFIIINISNSPQNISRGQKYPYHNIKFNALQKYFEIETLGWVQGNVLSISYACQNCDDPLDVSAPYVDVRGKLWVESTNNVAGGEQFQIIETQDGQFIAIVKYNILYIYNAVSKQIETMYRLTSEDDDEIIKFIVNHQEKLIITAVIDDEYIINIVVFSIHSFKGLQLSRLPLPTVLYIMNMEYVQNVLILLDFTNLYIISVDNNGNLNIVDYINEPEAGGAICWAEILGPIDNHTQYTLLLTLCDEGITFISFQLVEDRSVLKMITKQTINLKEDLKSHSIILPTDSTFRRSITTQSPDGKNITIIIIISKFNSIQWMFVIKNRVTVTDIIVKKIIVRYGDFDPTGDISLDFEGRFLLITYFGFYQAQYKYINAVYDMKDLYNSHSNYQHCYIMEAISAHNNNRAQFTPERNLIVLSEDGFHLSRIDVENMFRTVIHNENKLQSQPLFIVPYTPVSSLTIQLDIQGIDIVELSFWEIALIVLTSLTFIVISVFTFKVCFRKYQQKKKLVPLLQDYQEYEEDLAEEVKEAQLERERNSKTSNNRQSQNMNIINISERGSVNI